MRQIDSRIGRDAMRFATCLWVVALICLLSGSSAFGQTTPEITDPVTDRAGVVSAVTESDLGERLRAHYQTTGVQMAVLTVRTTDGEPIESFSLRTAQAWGGGDAGEDRGVLLTLAIDDRRSRLEVGYGLEPVISDSLAATYLRDMRQPLRDQRYDDAVRLAVDRVIDRTSHLESGGAIEPPDTSLLAHPFRGFYLVLTLATVVVGLPLLLHRRKVGPFGSGFGIVVALVGLVGVSAGVLWFARDIAPYAYAFVLILGFAIGVMLGIFDHITRVVTLVIYVLFGIFFLDFLLSPTAEWSDPRETLYLLAFGTFIIEFTCQFPILLAESTGFSGGGGSTYSSGSSVSSGSSFSSGGGFSGGGGSFGGGGASGGW